MGVGKISIDFDRAAEPRHRLPIVAEIEFGNANRRYPTEGKGVARAETERFADMSFSFLAAADEELGQTNCSVGGGQIPIQSQCPLAFGDGLVSELREN